MNNKDDLNAILNHARRDMLNVAAGYRKVADHKRNNKAGRKYRGVQLRARARGIEDAERMVSRLQVGFNRLQYGDALTNIHDHE